MDKTMRASEDQTETVDSLPPTDGRCNRKDEQRLGDLHPNVHELGLE